MTVAPEQRSVVVVGAGIAGASAAEALRREGHHGPITVLGEEPCPPYDRPPLSKDVLRGSREVRELGLRDPNVWDDLGVDLQLGRPARSLDLRRRRVLTDTSETPFDGLVLATGAVPRVVPALVGHPRVHVLRTAEDASRIRDQLTGARQLVVIGAGFIGAEVASSATAEGVDVTMVEAASAPMTRNVGQTVAKGLADLHQRHGVRLICGTTVVGVGGMQGVLLELSSGETLVADLVVIGIGADPNVSWLRGSGLDLGDGVLCDASLNAGPTDVFAIGDIARWPNHLFGVTMRVEHWTNAVEQARHVARNLSHGLADPFLGSRYVWSDQYGLRLQAAGLTAETEPTLLVDALAEGRYLACYEKQDRIVGVFGAGMAKKLARARALIEQRTAWAEALEILSDGVSR